METTVKESRGCLWVSAASLFFGIVIIVLACTAKDKPLPEIVSAISTQIITIDMCEYIVATDRHGDGASIIHKENCKFCINRSPWK